MAISIMTHIAARPIVDSDPWNIVGDILMAYKQLYSQATDGELTDPGGGGTISQSVSPAILQLTSAAAETRVLSDPANEPFGIFLTLFAKSVSAGNITITAPGGTDFDQDEHDQLVFDEDGQWITLMRSFDKAGNAAWRRVDGDQAILKYA